MTNVHEIAGGHLVRGHLPDQVNGRRAIHAFLSHGNGGGPCHSAAILSNCRRTPASRSQSQTPSSEFLTKHPVIILGPTGFAVALGISKALLW
jgi:hypothetical protein